MTEDKKVVKNNTVKINKTKKTVTFTSTKKIQNYAATQDKLKEDYKDSGKKYTKKVLDNNAIHMAKIHLGVDVIVESLLGLWEAWEITNYVDGARAFIVLDPIFGSVNFSHRLITVRSDGGINTQTIPWELFAIAYGNVNGKPERLKDVELSGEWQKIIDTFGIEYTDNKDGTIRDLVFPKFGDIVNIDGDISSVLVLETLSTKKDGTLRTYTKMLYNVIDSKCFEMVSTILLTDPLTEILSYIYSEFLKIKNAEEKASKEKK